MVAIIVETIAVSINKVARILHYFVVSNNFATIFNLDIKLLIDWVPVVINLNFEVTKGFIQHIIIVIYSLMVVRYFSFGNFN